MENTNVKQEIDRITQFLKQTFQNNGFTTAVLAVSGGIDSAVSLALSVKALGENNVYPLLFPYGPLNTQGVLDAMELIGFLHIPLSHVTRIDIKQSVDSISGRDVFTLDNVRKGNVMARIRMIYLFDQAKKRNALVVGTENKTERLLGYFTRFGDSASDIEPLTHLYKTQVYELATHLPVEASVKAGLSIPQSIVTKPPSAGLWPGQTDEKDFGFTYKDADAILPYLCDQKKTIEEIVALGFDRQTVERVSMRVSQNAFKHMTPYSLL